MQIALNRRAEIALRSLSAIEKTQVTRILERLHVADARDWRRLVHARKLQVPGEDDLYAVRGNEQLRLVIKDLSEALIVQDIVPHERLSRIVGSH